MKMAHEGRYPLDVPEAGLLNVTPGEAVEVEDSHVRALLEKQGWHYVHEPKKDDKKNDDKEGGDS